MFVGIIIVLTRLKFYKIFQNKRGLTYKDNPNGGRPWGMREVTIQLGSNLKQRNTI